MLTHSEILNGRMALKICAGFGFGKSIRILKKKPDYRMEERIFQL